MKSQILIFVIILSFVKCFAQKNTVANLDKHVIEYTKSLLEKKIDTICIYESYETGTWPVVFASDEIASKNCTNYDTYKSVSIIWKLNNETFIVKMDNCFEFSKTKIDGKSFWKYYILNRNEIKTEKN